MASLVGFYDDPATHPGINDLLVEVCLRDLEKL